MKKWIYIPITVLFLSFVICGLLVWGFLTNFYGLSISPDGEFLVVTDSGGVSIFRTADGYRVLHAAGKPYGALPYDQGESSIIAWSPNGENLAVGKINSGIWIWNVDDWKLVTERNGGEGWEYHNPGFAWSPDGSQLALATGEGEVWIWKKSDTSWKMIKSTEKMLAGIYWDPDGTLVMLRDHDMIDVQTGAYLGYLKHWIDGAGYVTWSPDGDNAYVFFDLGGGVMDVSTNMISFDAGVFPHYAWSPDGKYFASVSECTNELFVWDTDSNKLVRNEQQGNVIYALDWTGDGQLIALGVKDFNTMVWNVDTGEELLRLLVPPNWYCMFN